MLREADDFPDGLDELQRQFSNTALLPVEDQLERTSVVEALMQDLTDADKHRFRRTLRHVAQDPHAGTAAAISVLPDRYYVIRLRNDTLQRLVPGGHRLLDEIMRQHGPHGSGRFALHSCEIRERGHHEGFLHGYWQGGEQRFFRFLFAQRRARFIVVLFMVGLFLEVVFSFWSKSGDRWLFDLQDLGSRLGAPILVSSLVLILERRAQWRDQLDPRLRWSTTPTSAADPFRISPSDA